MKLSLDRFLAGLSKGALAPVYLIAGDEPLLVDEAADALRREALEQGYAERKVLFVERGFDWNQLFAEIESQSLFAQRRLLELRMPTGKPGAAGGKALAELMQRMPPDVLLLVITPKLDRSAASSRWCRALEKNGVYVQIWPIEGRALPRWIQARMRGCGLQATSEAAALLAERVEGNLLAASQEIEKLLLVHGPGSVDAEAIERAVADSARYDVFKLVDATLAGELARALRILQGLRSEGVEPVLVLWALTRELRVLAGVAWAADGGAHAEQALEKAGVWARRRPLFRSALGRLRSARAVHDLLQQAAAVDGVIKGAAPGDPWQELTGLAAGVAGTVVPSACGAGRRVAG